jgi:hypothetical protein
MGCHKKAVANAIAAMISICGIGLIVRSIGLRLAIPGVASRARGSEEDD